MGFSPEQDSLQWESFFPLWTILLMELQRNTHHVYRLMYHSVWIQSIGIKYSVNHIDRY